MRRSGSGGRWGRTEEEADDGQLLAHVKPLMASTKSKIGSAKMEAGPRARGEGNKSGGDGAMVEEKDEGHEEELEQQWFKMTLTWNSK
ncbi:hypothetical protein U1Q18_019403 [Sarracenia purpurea var. burkii]